MDAGAGPDPETNDAAATTGGPTIPPGSVAHSAAFFRQHRDLIPNVLQSLAPEAIPDGLIVTGLLCGAMGGIARSTASVPLPTLAPARGGIPYRDEVVRIAGELFDDADRMVDPVGLHRIIALMLNSFLRGPLSTDEWRAGRDQLRAVEFSVLLLNGGWGETTSIVPPPMLAVIADDWRTRPRAVVDGYEKWLARWRPELVTAALMYARLAEELDRDRFPVGVPAAQPAMRALARYAAERGAKDWWSAGRLALENWERRGATDLLLIATDCLETVDTAPRVPESTRVKEVRQQLRELTQRMKAQEAQHERAAADAERRIAAAQAAQAQAERLASELREQLRAQTVKTTAAARRAEYLTQELATLRETPCAICSGQTEALAAQARLADDEATAEAPAPSTGSGDDVPADALQGQTVYVYTNQAKAGAREQMREAFAALGAETVELYYTAKSRGPTQLPTEALVVIDVSFMDHWMSNEVKERARRSQCWYYEGRHGTRSLATAAARAWGQTCRRAASPEADDASAA